MSRVYKRGRNHYIDYNDAQGVRHRKKIGPSKRVTNEVLNNTLDKVAREEFLGVVQESPISFADFAKEWWSSLRPDLKARTRERWKGILDQHLKPHFRGALRSITASAAEAYVSKRANEKAQPSTINREMTVLKSIMRKAVSRRYLARNRFLDSQAQLVEGLKPLKEPPGRVRYLSEEEIARLLVTCSSVPYLKAFTLAALNTGMRRNEILSLTRQSIDWINRMARVEITKNGEARNVALNDTAFEALESLPTRLDGRLFPLKPNQVSVAFQRAVRRAAIENFRLHDLRHCFASYQAMSGTQQPGLQALLGHKDGRMTLRYTHLADTYLRAAVNRVNLGRGNSGALKAASESE